MAFFLEEDERQDRRVLRTRKAIMDAFYRLIVNEDISKITVSAVAREANIDRKTFYLHFNSIDDLVNKKAKKDMERVIEAVKEYGFHQPLPERMHVAMIEINKILEEQADIYEHIASRVSLDQIIAYFEHATEFAVSQEGFRSEVTQNPRFEKVMQFYAAGALSLYVNWLKTGRPEPVENISSVIEAMILPYESQS